MVIKQTYSVIIPLYNKSDTIDRTLDSVLAQDHDIEIVVIDDGSTDDGPHKVRSRRDPRIRLIPQSNLGVSAARNMGIETASNELIALIDADDEWLSGFLDVIDVLVDRYPFAGAYTTSYRIVRNQDVEDIFHPKIGHPFTGIPDYFLCVNEREFFCSSSIVVRKRAMEHIGGFKTNLWLREDSDAWGRLSFRYDIAHCSEIKAVYHLSGGNHATHNRAAVTYSFADSVADFLKEHPENKDINLREYANTLLVNSVFHNILSGHTLEARSMLDRRPSNALFYNIFLCYWLSLIPARTMGIIKGVYWKLKAPNNH